MTQQETARLLEQMTGTNALMAKLMYGSGLRLMECIRLRIQDVDFGQLKIFIRGGKGGAGHAVVKTTEIYTHVMRKDIDGLKSPLDLLQGP